MESFFAKLLLVVLFTKRLCKELVIVSFQELMELMLQVLLQPMILNVRMKVEWLQVLRSSL